MNAMRFTLACSAALILAALKAAPAGAQCLACKNSVLPNGEIGCNATLAGPFASCGCPCACAGSCPVSPPEDNPVTPMAFSWGDDGVVLAADLPAAGRLVAGAPDEALLAGLQRATIFGQPAEHVWMGADFGLVRYADGAWRVFPLESAESFAIRDCSGNFVTRARRGEPRPAPPPVSQAA